MRSAMLRILLTSLALSALACDYSGQPDGPPGPVPVQGVRVTPQSVQLSSIGETKQLVAVVSPLDATDQAVTWESTDPSIVSVNASGLVTANAVGSGVFVTVITHDGQHQASVNVTVNP